MKWLFIIGLLLMAAVHNEILSLIVLCVFAFAGIVRLFEAMADHSIL